MENKRKNHAGIAFWEYEITLAKTMVDTLRTTVEFLYYLMEHRTHAPFSMILITSEKLQSSNELQRMKRGSDLLFELDKDHGTYVIICQATDRDGVEQYAEILLGGLRAHLGSNDTYCVTTTVATTHHSILDVIFRMVETYVRARKTGQKGEVIFSDLQNDDTPKKIAPLH